MKLEVVEKSLYKKVLKKLAKRYRNIEKDVDDFLNAITTKEDLGIELKSNIFKARIRNSDKHKGKSAGYRLISYLAVIDSKLYLLYIYDKSQIENLSEKEIDSIILQQLSE